ncbi:Ectopic P granules protein 5, partial [Quaeritorhiza haematococci]
MQPQPSPEFGKEAMEMMDLCFSILANGESTFAGDSDDRLSRFLNALERKCLSGFDWKLFGTSDMVNVVSRLPVSWTASLESGMELAPVSEGVVGGEWEAKKKATAHPLPFVLHALRVMAGVEKANVAKPMVEKKGISQTYLYAAQVTPEDESTTKVEVYMSYVFDLICTQVHARSTANPNMKSLQPPSTPDTIVADFQKSPQTFKDTQLSNIIFENLLLVETVAAEQLTSTHPSSSEQSSMAVLQYTFQRTFTLLNMCERGGFHAKQVWEGILQYIHKCHAPIQLINEACQTIASAEHMAVVVETCIERYLSLHRRDDGSVWTPLLQALVVPELEADLFIRQCLDHALVLTLYAHALQKLDECKNNIDFQVMIGEQLGVWLTSIKLDTISENKEGKIVLLLAKFAELLALELG